MSLWQMFLSYFLNLTKYYVLCHYQEANKIVNMMVLDLLLFYKRKLTYGTTFYHKEIKDQVLGTNVPKNICHI